MIRRVLGSAVRLGGRGTQSLTYRMRLALEPEYLATPTFAAGHKGYSFLEELSSAIKTCSKKEEPLMLRRITGRGRSADPSTRDCAMRAGPTTQRRGVRVGLPYKSRRRL
jgi:hypothetical protein